MKFDISKIDKNYNFSIYGASYAGKPISGTAMYITAKVQSLMTNLEHVTECLIFIEKGMQPSEEAVKKNCFVYSDNPQLAYAKFMSDFEKEKHVEESKMKYTMAPGGYFIGEKTSIGENAYIEPGCVIGHGVVIGKDARIYAGAIIKNAIIGDNFICNENAVVGANGFTMAEDEYGNKFRIPTLGKVVIGNNVEIGQLNSISIGSGGDTYIQDNVKLDGLVHIGHNDNLGKNTEIPAGVIISGFVNTGEHAYLGVNSAVRNRRDLGANCVIGMGAVVTKNVEDGMTVIGNPAREYIKKN
jgi:UDP-3-O-[3-hydroxymyristoyl] glucosamine N-acyltransferase LpxD